MATSGESFTELEVGKALDVSVPAGTVVDRVAVMEDISKGEVRKKPPQSIDVAQRRKQVKRALDDLAYVHCTYKWV